MPNHARAGAIALLLLTTALAGCLGGSDEDITPTSEPAEDGIDQAPEDQSTSDPPPSEGEEGANRSAATGTLAQLALEGCVEHLGLFPLPVDVVGDELPPGFAPEPFEGIPGTIGFFVVAITCQTGSTGTLDIAEPGLVAGGVTVQPPQEMTTGADVHGLLVGALAEGDGFTDQLRAWGLPAQPAAISQNTVQTGPVGVGQSVGSVGDFQVALATEVTAGVEAGPGYHARIFALDEYTVTGWIDVRTEGATAGGSGSATFAFPEVPPAHEGLGLMRTGEDYRYAMLHTPVNATEPAP